MEKFKYRTMRAYATDADLAEKLEQLGEGGWELVAAVPPPSNPSAPLVWVFKRPFASDEYGGWAPL